MKIAFFTPLTPMKSGVSDFCEELLVELQHHMEIDLFVGDYEPMNETITKNFRIRKFKDFEAESVRNEYDEVIYQIGNNEACHEEIYKMAIKYPGIIELHDISLHHMQAAMTIARGDVEGYKRIMEYCHGKGALEVVDQFLRNEILPPWEENSLIFTLNKEIIDVSKAIIVHSDYAKQMVKGVKPDANVELIYLHADEINENYEEVQFKARKELGIPQDEMMFASFGFITKPKRIIQILESLKAVKEQGYEFKYYIVGQVDTNLEIEKYINEYGLGKNVIITGFVELEYMKQLMRACNICFSLRYPTQGESSAIVHRLLGMGKIIFVTDVGTFSEYPEGIIVKIEVSDEIECILRSVMAMLEDKEKCHNISINAVKFSSEKCKIENNAKIYFEFLDKKYSYLNISLEEFIVEQMNLFKISNKNIIRKIMNHF